MVPNTLPKIFNFFKQNQLLGDKYFKIVWAISSVQLTLERKNTNGTVFGLLASVL